MIELILKAIWFIIPAYIANLTPAIISKSKKVQKYNRPIDGGKLYKGKTILGKSKTYLGLILGVLVGTLIGIFQSTVQIEPLMTISLAFMLSLGALVGDIVGSLIKRRLNIDRGRPAPFLDQLDFLAGAFLFAGLITTINFNYLIILLAITPIVHLSANVIGYKLKIKNEPW